MPVNMIIGNSFFSRNNCRSRQGGHSYRDRISNRSFFEEIIRPKVEWEAERNVVEWRIFDFWLCQQRLIPKWPAGGIRRRKRTKDFIGISNPRPPQIKTACITVILSGMCGGEPTRAKFWLYIIDRLVTLSHMTRLAEYWKLGTMNSDFKCRHCRV